MAIFVDILSIGALFGIIKDYADEDDDDGAVANAVFEEQQEHYQMEESRHNDRRRQEEADCRRLPRLAIAAYEAAAEAAVRDDIDVDIDIDIDEGCGCGGGVAVEDNGFLGTFGRDADLENPDSVEGVVRVSGSCGPKRRRFDHGDVSRAIPVDDVAVGAIPTFETRDGEQSATTPAGAHAAEAAYNGSIIPPTAAASTAAAGAEDACCVGLFRITSAVGPPRT